MEGVSTEPESAKHKLAAEESSTPAAKKAKFDGENGENGMMLDEVKVERVKNCWNCEQVGHMQKECPEPQKPVEGADCEVCKIFVKKIHSEFHYNADTRHAKKVKRATAPPPVPYNCTICNVTIIGEVPYNAHLEGKKHKKKVESPTFSMDSTYALNKKLKRAADKVANDENNAKKMNNQLISEILLKLVNEIPHKAELLKARKRSKAKTKAVKRAAVKEAANVLPKRQKYAR